VSDVADLLAAWNALSKTRRSRVKDAIAKAIVSRHADPDVEGEPHVDIIAATQLGTQVTVHFVVDQYAYSRHQSGSDSAGHYIHAGYVLAEHPFDVQLVDDRSVALTELDSEHYDRDAIVKHLRGATLAKLSGTAAPAPIDELARVRAIVDDHARAANARAVAVSPTAITVVRCPKCGSTDAGATEAIFELTRMTCRTCGHEAHADHYEIGEDWNLSITLPPGVTELPAFVPPVPPRTEHATSTGPGSRADESREPGRAPSLGSESGGALGADLRCPRCGSSKVAEDPGRAERHFAFLACGKCDHGEEIDSLTAASRWKRSE
jgi:transcription elongation factor Elf1